MIQFLQLSNGGRDHLEFVVVQIQLLQERIIEKRGRQCTQTLAAEIESMPALSWSGFRLGQSVPSIEGEFLGIGLAGCDLDSLGLLRHRASVVVWRAGLACLRGQLQLLLPVLVHLIEIIVQVGVDPILHMARGEMRRGGGQRGRGEVVLGQRLSVVRVVMRLLGMCMVGLRLKLGDLHAKSLVGLATTHHDMLALVGLTVHGERIDGGGLRKRRRAGRRGSVGIEL